MNKSLHHGHPLLRVENLSIQNFRSGGEDSKILDEISFDVFPGEIVGLIGESGSGKTISSKAILRMLPNSMKITSGSISFKEIDLLSLNNREYENFRGKSIALIPQDALHALNPVQKVGTQVAEPFSIHGNLTKKEKKSKVIELFSRVNITNPENRYDNYPHEFSGGMQQRALTASSIALKPPLIIADEPTAGLDVSVQGEILNLLNKLRDDLGVSLFVITHNLNIVRHISDKTAVMYLGRFVEQGQTDDIFANPRHPYTLALLSANLTPYPEVSFENRIELTGEVPSLMDRPNGCEFHTRCPFSSEHCDDEFPPIHTFKSQQILTCHYPLNSN